MAGNHNIETMNSSSSQGSLPNIHNPGSSHTPSTPSNHSGGKPEISIKNDDDSSDDITLSTSGSTITSPIKKMSPSVRSARKKKKKGPAIASFDVFARFRSELIPEEGSVPTVQVVTTESDSRTTLQFLNNNYELKKLDMNQTAIFNRNETQDELYNSIGSHYITQLMNGSNMTMIFYGKSRAGKSYCAGMNKQSFSPDHRTLDVHDGILKRLLNDAFSRSKSFGSMNSFSISMIEVTSAGKMIDLLNEDHASKTRRTLVLKGNFRYFPAYEDESDVMASRSRYPAPSIEAAMALVHRGIQRIEKDETTRDLSHILFFLHFTNTSDSPSLKNTSTLCIADLKGTRRTDKAAKNVREVIKVNRSLSFLSNVFSDMRKSNRQHETTFRSHTLTKILKYLLLAVDRHSHVALIVCCNTSRYDLDENISALRVGGIVSKIRSTGGGMLSPNAKRMRSKQEPNEFVSNLKIKELTDQLRAKQGEIKKLKQKLKDQLKALTVMPTSSYWTVDSNMLEQGKKVANGIHGDVFSGRVMVSLKETQSTSEDAIQRRFKMLHSLDHPFILKYLGYTSNFYIMEYCEHGNLYEYISKKKLKNGSKYKLSLQIAEAMDYLHSHNMIHRGLSASSILLDGSLNAKLSDIDVSDSAESTIDNQERTYATVAPELFFANVDQLIDIYSYGILLYEIWLQKRPFTSLRKQFNNQRDLLNHIHAKSLRPSFDNIDESICPNQIIEMMKACWSIQPQDRYQSFKDIVSSLLSWHETLFNENYAQATHLISELKSLVRQCVENDEIDHCTALLNEMKILQEMVQSKPSPNEFVSAIQQSEQLVHQTRSMLQVNGIHRVSSKDLLSRQSSPRGSRSHNASSRSLLA